MQWNDVENKFKNELNFNEFLSWLYPRDFDEIEEDALGTSSIPGKWENRKFKGSKDLRSVSYLIRNSKSEFEMFRVEGDVDKAYTLSLQKKYEEEARKLADPTSEVYEVLEECTKALENVPFKMLRDENQRTKLMDFLGKLSSAIAELQDS